MMTRIAVPQMLLTLLCFTSFHVQIINRISSGYPLWYIVLAIMIHADDDGPHEQDDAAKAQQPPRKLVGTLSRRSAWRIVRGMVMYAIVQGGLYSSFLPPA